MHNYPDFTSNQNKLWVLGLQAVNKWSRPKCKSLAILAVNLCWKGTCLYLSKHTPQPLGIYPSRICLYFWNKDDYAKELSFTFSKECDHTHCPSFCLALNALYISLPIFIYINSTDADSQPSQIWQWWILHWHNLVNMTNNIIFSMTRGKGSCPLHLNTSVTFQIWT